MPADIPFVHGRHKSLLLRPKADDARTVADVLYALPARRAWMPHRSNMFELQTASAEDFTRQMKQSEACKRTMLEQAARASTIFVSPEQFGHQTIKYYSQRRKAPNPCSAEPAKQMCWPRRSRESFR